MNEALHDLSSGLSPASYLASQLFSLGICNDENYKKQTKINKLPTPQKKPTEQVQRVWDRHK